MYISHGSFDICYVREIFRTDQRKTSHHHYLFFSLLFDDKNCNQRVRETPNRLISFTSMATFLCSGKASLALMALATFLHSFAGVWAGAQPW